MNDISITEAYFVYSVQGKGKLSGNDCRKVTGLLTAALWEMAQSGIVSVNAGSIQLCDIDTFARSWFQPLYEHIKEMEQKDLALLLQDYCSSWSDRHLNALANEIGLVLEKQKLITRAKLGIFNGRTYFMPHQSTIPELNAELQVDILYQNPVSTDTAFLWLLLKQAHCIPSGISEEIQDTFTCKIKKALAEGADPALISAKALSDQSFSLMKKGYLIID